MSILEWIRKDPISYRSVCWLCIVQGVVMVWLMVTLVGNWIQIARTNDLWAIHVRDLEKELLMAQKKMPIKVVDVEQVRSEQEIPIGIKNNNPCNVKVLSKGKWQGEVGSDQFGHVIFSHPVWSYRAATILLVKYQSIHKLDTLEKMMNRYCTANQQEYATYLAKRIGIKTDQEFVVERYLSRILEGITTFENKGMNPYPKHFIAPFTVWENLVSQK